uniref:Uncharacterized protein n=1 Tax=Rangifer tarandus platyrhynchus TaxID=3082113 RepID=A0ACB0DQ09_RANTA|nr:unnamed protein product [Rangifer tarandus platyrhynchus]
MTPRSQGFCADTPLEAAVRAFTPSPPEHRLWARSSEMLVIHWEERASAQLFQEEVLEATQPTMRGGAGEPVLSRL